MKSNWGSPLAFFSEALAEIARQRQEDPHEMNHADDALVVNATALIAELKRCYEEIDQLRETAQMLAQAHISVYGLDD